MKNSTRNSIRMKNRPQKLSKLPSKTSSPAKVIYYLLHESTKNTLNDFLIMMISSILFSLVFNIFIRVYYS